MGYLARHNQKVGDRYLTNGMPVPSSAVTRTLLRVGWVEKVDPDVYRAAVDEYGEPPKGPIPADGRWLYKGEQKDKVQWASGYIEAETPNFKTMSVSQLQDYAAALAIDPETIEGSGKDGNLLKEDWIMAIEAKLEEGAAAPA